jgi:multidrug efflux pump subunit AcrA (membrane-fusion protein)
MSRIVRALGFLIAASAAVASPVAVPTLEVKGAAVRDAFELDGRVEPVRQATVAAQLPGHVLALAVKAGDAVRAGQSIARIDDRDAQAGFAAADAGVSQADANLRNARLSAQRTRDLSGQGFVSQAALDVADTQLQG